MHEAMSKHAIFFYVMVALPAIRGLNAAGKSTELVNITRYDESLKCGGSLSSPDGKIGYKQFELVGKNERCVWIVQPVNFTSVEIRLSPNSTAPMAGNLLVSGIANYGGGPIDVDITQIEPTTTAATIRNASLIVVTFVTEANASGSGFLLLYSFRDAGGVRASPDSVNVIASADLGYIRHPKLQTAMYPNSDLSVFILLPNETCNSPNKLRLLYSQIELEGNLKDGLVVFDFGFSPWYPFYWNYWGRIYSDKESLLITAKDMLMVVFASDQSGRSEGFELVYAVC